MTFRAATCPDCGGDLQLPDDHDVVKCMYCGTDIVVREALRESGVAGPRIETLLNLAQKAMEGNNVSEANQLYSRALELNPKSVPALMGKGWAAGWQSTVQNLRFTEMATYFNEALSQAPVEQQTQLGKLACQHINTVYAAVWSMVCDHAFKFAAADDTWGEFVQRARLLVSAGQQASSYDPTDSIALNNIITVCDQLLEGIKYVNYRGYPDHHKLAPVNELFFQTTKETASLELKKVDPSYEPPLVPVKKDTSAGCALLVIGVLLLGIVIFTMFAISFSNGPRDSQAAAPTVNDVSSTATPAPDNGRRDEHALPKAVDTFNSPVARYATSAGDHTPGTLPASRVNTPTPERPQPPPPIAPAIDAIRADAQARGLVFVEFNENGRMYHEATCPATTEKMQLATRNEAIAHGYLPAWDCHKPQ